MTIAKVPPTGANSTSALTTQRLYKKKKAALFAALALPFSAAQAADDFAGPYVAGSLALSNFFAQFQDINDELDNQGLNGETELSLNPTLAAGIDFQDGNFVYGAELGYTFFTAESENVNPTGSAGDGSLLNAELKSAISLKGKIGVANGANLIYVTAGLAQADADLSVNYDTWVAGAVKSDSVSMLGLSYGVGIAHRFGSNFVASLQGEQLQFETSDQINNVDPASDSSFSFNGSIFNVTGTIAYKF